MTERVYVKTPAGFAVVEHVGINVLKVVVDGKTTSEWWSRERLVYVSPNGRYYPPGVWQALTSGSTQDPPS